VTRTGFCIALALAALAALAGPASAQRPKPIKPTQTWRGSIDDLALLSEAPKGERVADAKAFEKLWNAWKVGAKLPEVDFSKSAVFVTTTRGSRLSHGATLDDKGNLRVGAIATRDLRPGFRYSIILVPLAGVKTINGKPFAASDEPKKD
jgi:hypothetical protein